MLENEAYFLRNTDDGVFGTKNGRSDLIKAVLAQVSHVMSYELEAISSCVAVAVEDRTLVSISTNRQKKRKLNIEDYASKEQRSLLENLRFQRKDLQAELDSVMEKEEALMAELVQTAAAEDIDPEPASKVEEKPGRADITSASLKLLFAMRKCRSTSFSSSRPHVKNFEKI